MGKWEEKGCVVCRRQWESGVQPPRLGLSLARNAYLHQCQACGAYWEQFERYADIISKDDAKKIYGEIVLNHNHEYIQSSK